MTTSLTPAELDVLTYLARGRRPKDIAVARDCAYKTVLAIQGNLYSKLGVSCIGECIAKAHELGLVGSYRVHFASRLRDVELELARLEQAVREMRNTLNSERNGQVHEKQHG